MRVIKFSKSYLKLPADANGKPATLLYAKEIELADQVSYLMEYDTRATDGSTYALPPIGRYILLLFDCEGTIFTTFRRSTPEKLNYYLNAINSKFLVVVLA